MRIQLRNRASRIAAVLSAACVAVVACTEETPSGLDDSQLPAPPATVSLELSWAEFGSNLQVYGGYSSPDEMASTVVAKSYGGVEARTLLSFDNFPTSVQVLDSSKTLTTDTALTFLEVYLVAKFDTLSSTNVDSVLLEFGETAESWHAPSATWTHAWNFQTVQTPWSQPGGGAVTPNRTGVWNRASMGDSVQIFFDSAQIARWRTAPDSVRSGRLDLLTDGHRLKVDFAALRLVVTPKVNPDTVVVLTVPTLSATYIYDPAAAPPTDGLRVGGAPAWRTVLDLALPSTLSGPPELCAAAGCPFVLSPGNVTYAALGVRTRRPPDAFLPTDTVSVDVRAVLSRSALPRSPLGVSVVGDEGSALPPSLFGAGEGTLVDIPITAFVQAFLSGPDPTGRPPTNTLAILATPEPETFTFAEFFGPGGPNAPVLKLILTASPPMELP